MLAAQGYQESTLNQDLKSPRGAVGIMQVMPKYAAASPINIDNVRNADERRLNFRVCGAQFRIGWPKALIDDAVKRLGSFEAPVSACEHARQSQECMMPRSFCRPMACHKCGGRHPSHC